VDRDYVNGNTGTDREISGLPSQYGVQLIPPGDPPALPGWQEKFDSSRNRGRSQYRNRGRNRKANISSGIDTDSDTDTNPDNLVKPL